MRHFLFLLLLASFFDQASAATVTYTQDRRSVWVGGNLSGSKYIYPSTPYADMSTVSGYYAPLQNSSLGADGFTAFGSGDADYPSSPYGDGWYRSESVFDITFSVANGTTMTLSGELFGMNMMYGVGHASIFLYRGDNQLSENLLYQSIMDSWGGPQTSAIDYSALLRGGQYRLIATANPYPQDSHSSYSLTASFTPVPVPAAAWLLGSGLLGLLGFMKKRKPAMA